MIMHNPTRTTNRLHFEDLDPHRFEDLAYELLYRKEVWKRIDNFGRSGADDGIDIFCEDSNGEKWFCQCKRYVSISESEIKTVVNKIVSKNDNTHGGNILLVVACEVSKKANNAFDDYSESLGFKNAVIWTASTLEAMLWSSHKDLLSKYFGPGEWNNLNKEKVLQGNKMKKEIQKKLLRKTDWNHNTRMRIAEDPSLQFKYTKALIRSINDVDDPYGDEARFCQICFFQLTEVGIEFFDCYWIDFRIAINTNTRCWRKIENDEELMENEFDVRADHTVLIPYYCIVDIMEEGDERSDYPVIVCDYMFNNTPFLRSYFKNRKTKADFMDGKPVDIPYYNMLYEEFQRKSLNKSIKEQTK